VLSLLSINIGLDPNIGKVFGLLLTWHGIFTAVGIVAGVWLSVRIAASERVGIDPDTAYTLGMIIVACGIIGARGLYVIENYGDPLKGVTSIGDIFKINEGGISIYGALIGGAVGGWAWGLWKRLPCARGADAASFGMLLGLAIGRIGDLINGEHLAKHSSLPWALTYSHPNSPAFARAPMAPAVEYEGLMDLVILGLLAFVWRLHPKSGVIFSLAFLLYSVMRFFVSFLRIDSKPVVWGLTTPQVVSLLIIPISLALLVFFLRRKEPEHTPFVYGQAARRQTTSRAERRRRARATQPAGRTETPR